MLIQDLVVIPNRGTILIVSTQDPDFENVRVGSKLQQGSTLWDVVGIERAGTKPTGGVLVTPVAPVPDRGDISLVTS